MTKQRWIKPWVGVLALIAAALIGGLLVLIILIQGLGVKLSGLQGGALALLWAIFVFAVVWDRVHDRRL